MVMRLSRAGAGALLLGCSWPDFAFLESAQTCRSDMLLCSRFEDEAASAEWIAQQSGAAHFENALDPLTNNRVLRFETDGAEGPPVPFAAWTHTPEQALTHGRILFQLRIEELGPYTQHGLVDLDLGGGRLRVFVHNTPERKTVTLQFTSRTDVAFDEWVEPEWELDVPDDSEFRVSRWIEISFRLNEAPPRVGVSVDGVSLIEAAALDTRVQTAVDAGVASHGFALRSLHVGVLGMRVPCSGSRFSFDDIGLDAPNQ
jgi:hypothetical protein